MNITYRVIDRLKFALISFILLNLFFVVVKAQIPTNFLFQITVRDYNKNIIANKELGARISIVSQNSETFYQEDQLIHTNSQGLASIEIGAGSNKQGSLKNVEWENGNLYIRAAIDPEGGANYSIISYTALASVPYAFHASKIANPKEKDPVFEHSVANSLSKINIAKWNGAAAKKQNPGDRVGGGVVFYVDSSGESGLIVTPFDISEKTWWMPVNIDLPTCNNLTDGKLNTSYITQQAGEGEYAAYVCDTFTYKGKNGWYLPSINELSMLFNSRYQVNRALGGDPDSTTTVLAHEPYWSSTQWNKDSALMIDQGNILTEPKERTGKVRAIRHFSGLYDVNNYFWTYLGGPEEENGDPVQILENSNGNLLLDVKGKRGTVFRGLPEMKLPVRITFDLQTRFDPDASEPPTELFGTGDFRLYVGGPNKNNGDISMQESNLGEFEGVQFRIFPHVDQSPIRRYTYNDGDKESHTCTSIWIRYIDPDRITGAGGVPHTGLVSDACQNRNKPPTHNCGWARVALLENGFGLENGEETRVTIIISQDIISLEANGRVFSVKIADLVNDDSYSGDILRFDRVNSFAVGHTNISRGYETLKITNMRIIPLK